MKRFHVHVSVSNLQESIGFYSRLFGATPTIEKPDYAKWMLDDPRVNFAISQRGHALGVNHLGIQVDSDAELRALRDHIDDEGLTAVRQSGTDCCYAHADKHWLQDPQGIAWETFHTLHEVPVFGEENVPSSCCSPVSSVKQSCCG